MSPTMPPLPFHAVSRALLYWPSMKRGPSLQTTPAPRTRLWWSVVSDQIEVRSFSNANTPW